MDEIKICDLFDLAHTRAAQMLMECGYPWEAISRIRETVLAVGASLPAQEYDHPQEDVWIARTAVISPLATITGPCIIGERTQVRPGAYLRGSVLVGDDAVVGNSTELKNCILFDGVQVPHYNYVGDSILGYLAHMGAGAVASNVRGDKRAVTVRGECAYETGLRKLGAMIGDRGEIGCGSVLNPGTVIGRNTQVYPLTSVRGVIPARSIVKGERGVFLRRDEA